MNSENSKQVVIVGGLGLIGKAVVLDLQKKKYFPIVIDVKKKDEVDLNQCDYLEADLSTLEDINKVQKILASRYSNICGWVNAAYPRSKYYGTYNFLDDDKEDGIDFFSIHSAHCYRASRLAVQILKASGGSLVNFGSIYGPMGPDLRIYDNTSIHNAAAYAMAKEAIIGLTRYIATSFAGDHIRCNAVCPGGIFDSQNEIFVKQYSARVPMNRMGTPEEIAGVVSFLISSDSSYMTGQIIMADGGLSAW